MIQPLEDLKVLRDRFALLLSERQVIRGIVEAYCFHRWQAHQYQEEKRTDLWHQEYEANAELLRILAIGGVALADDNEDEEILHVYQGGKIIDLYHDGAAGWLIQCQQCQGVVLESMTTWKNDRIVCEDCARK